MKGLYGRKGFDIITREFEDIPVTGRMVRVSIDACGVCGTDIHFLRENADYTPMGHEIAGTVVEVGPEVSHVRKGDRVICEDVTMCGACDKCKSGQVRLCRSPYTLSGQPGMSDEIVVHENMLNVYTGIDPVTACMTEPLAVALRGVIKLSLRPLSSLAVIGTGAIGLFSAACAHALGAGRIAMFAHRAGSLRAQAAESAASDYGVDEMYYQSDPNDLGRALQKGAFDACIVAAPPAMCEMAMRLVGYGGNVLAQGITFGDGAKVLLDVNDMVFNKKQLLTSIAEPALNFPLSIDFIRTGRIDARRVITNTLSPARASELADLYGADSLAIKTVICG